MLARWSGSHWPFPGSEAQRRASADPRLSLEERYGDKETYMARVAEAALDLQQRRFLLNEDVAAIIQNAARRRLFD